MEIIKASSDYRTYKYDILENEIEVVFAHDTKALSSGVSLAVGVGSYEDPVFGLAHFLEHMLFMGNEKYKDEKEYSSFILSHGGYTNAYTAGDHTNYFFTIDSEYIIKAMDMFSNFFISPTFNESSVSREMNAVNSEHDKNIQDDNWRNHIMIKNICGNTSPLSKFNTGNLETLNIPNIRDILINFFEKYYSSNIMKLTVLYNGESEEEFNKVINETKKIFSQIKNKNVNINRTLDKKHLSCNKFVKMIPVKDEENLMIIFELEFCEKNKTNNLIHYISYLLNHRGDGSLGNHLIKTGQIDNLIIGEECNIGETSIFTVKFNLTDKSDINLILDCFKKYLNILIEATQEDKILDLLEEDRFLNNQTFEEFEISDEGDFVSQLTADMLTFKGHREYVLKYNYLVGEFIKKDDIKKELKILLEGLDFNNNNYSIINISKKYKKYNNLQTEKYYNIKYTIEDLEENKSSKQSGLFHFPEKNKFIVKHKEMLKGETDKTPKYEKIEPNINTYLKMNYDLNTKDTQLFLAIYKDDIYQNIETYINYLFYFEYFKLLNNNLMFDINKANYNVGFLLNKTNYTITMTGYYSKLSEILEILVNKLKNLKNSKMDKLSFDIIKSKLQKKYRNLKYDALYKKISLLEDEIILNKYFSNDIIEEHINKIKQDDLIDLNLFDYSRITIFGEGNINNHNFKEINTILQKYYTFNKLYKDEEVNIKDNILNKKIDKLYEKQNKEDPNSCISKLVIIDKFDYSTESVKIQCLANVFDTIVSKDFFDLLRTKDQLGYIVNSRSGVIGFTNKQHIIYRFLVQSSVKKTDYLDERINKFIKSEIKEILDNLKLEEFEEIKKSIKEKYTKPINNLGESSMYHYDKIINKNFMYNHNQLISSNILECTKEELIEFYNKYFVDKNIKYVNIKLE